MNTITEGLVLGIKYVTSLVSVLVAVYVAYRSGRREQLAEDERKREKLKKELEQENELKQLRKDVNALSSKIEEIEKYIRASFNILTLEMKKISNGNEGK